MKDIKFQFDPIGVTTCFPFYILMDKDFNIIFFGKILSNLYPNLKNKSSFFDFFRFKTPNFDIKELDTIKEFFSKSVIIQSQKETTLEIRGQFNNYKDFILFDGTSSFVSKESTASFQESNFIENIFSEFNSKWNEIIEYQEFNKQDFKEIASTLNNPKEVSNTDSKILRKKATEIKSNLSGILLMHSNGSIFWSNDAYLNLTNFENYEVIGHSLLEFLVSNESDLDLLKTIISSLQKGIDFEGEIFHKKKKGPSFRSSIK